MQLVEAFSMVVNIAELSLPWKVMTLASPLNVTENIKRYGAIAYLEGRSKGRFNRMSPRIILLPVASSTKIKTREAQIVFAKGDKRVVNPLWMTEGNPSRNLRYWKHIRDFREFIHEFRKLVLITTF